MIRVVIPTRVHAGTALKMIREARNISRKEMELDLKMSGATLCQIEKGQYIPLETRLKEMCDYLRVDFYLIILFAYTQDNKSRRKIEKTVNKFRAEAVQENINKRVNKKRLLPH